LYSATYREAAGEDTHECEHFTITDNRTGSSMRVAIENGTIKAMDLRQVKTSDEDFGLMTYDPAFMNTASCQKPDHFY